MAPSGTIFLNDCRQSAQGLVGLPGGWERGGYIGFQNDDRTSRGIPRRVPVPSRLAEVVLRQDLIGRNLAVRHRLYFASSSYSLR